MIARPGHSSSRRSGAVRGIVLRGYRPQAVLQRRAGPVPRRPQPRTRRHRCLPCRFSRPWIAWRAPAALAREPWTRCAKTLDQDSSADPTTPGRDWYGGPVGGQRRVGGPVPAARPGRGSPAAAPTATTPQDPRRYRGVATVAGRHARRRPVPPRRQAGGGRGTTGGGRVRSAWRAFLEDEGQCPHPVSHRLRPSDHGTTRGAQLARRAQSSTVARPSTRP